MSFIVKLMQEHVSAPRWGAALDDGLTPADLDALRAFEERYLAGEKDPQVAALTRKEAVETAIRRARASAHGRKTLADGPRDAGLNELERLPTTARTVLASAPATLVPDAEDLARLAIVRTSGTSTGQPAAVPHHPVALGAYAVLIRATLRRRGIAVELGPEVVGLMRVESEGGSGATSLKALGGTGFAQLDLAPEGWRDPLDPPRFVQAFAPAIIAGTPLALEMLATRAEASATRLRVKAVLSVGAEMSLSVRDRIERVLGAPLIDWYSAVETGPIAYACRSGRLHVLPHDLHVETLAEGELAVSGGRNPFLPLVRYRPGDRGTVERGPCACGDPSPRIAGLKRVAR